MRYQESYRDASQIHPAANSGYRRLMPADIRGNLDRLQRLSGQFHPASGVDPCQPAGTGRRVAEPATPRRPIRRRDPHRVHRGAGNGAQHGNHVRGRQVEGERRIAGRPRRGQRGLAERAEESAGLQRNLFVLGTGRDRRPGLPLHRRAERQQRPDRTLHALLDAKRRRQDRRPAIGGIRHPGQAPQRRAQRRLVHRPAGNPQGERARPSAICRTGQAGLVGDALGTNHRGRSLPRCGRYRL